MDELENRSFSTQMGKSDFQKINIQNIFPKVKENRIILD